MFPLDRIQVLVIAADSLVRSALLIARNGSRAGTGRNGARVGREGSGRVFLLVGRSGGLKLGRWDVAADRRGGILFGPLFTTEISTAHAAILLRLPGRVRLRFGDVAAFGAAIGCGAKIVAAVRAEADAMTATRAENGAKAYRGEDGEEEGEEPVWELNCSKW